jgi:hypothetical protein
MQPIVFENILNRERVVCENLAAKKWVDGVEYLAVRQEHNSRIFLIRRDILRPVRRNTTNQ